MKEINLNKPVTAYLQGGMGMSINKIEGKLKGLGTKKWAQYDAAPFIDIVPKGKRKARRYMQTHDPYMLVLEGTGHPNLDDGFNTISSTEDLTVRESNYLSFDPRWKLDADKEIDSYIAKNKPVVLADFRKTKGFSSYTKNSRS